MNLNELMTEKGRLKARLTELRAEEKDLKKADEEIDRQLKSEMDQHGLSRTANDTYSASINIDTVPQVTDWDTLFAYLLETKELSLFQRRLSSAGCKEVWAAGGTIPGVESREIRRINFRTL